uniref:CARD domain-containing protein n=1 Tax=Poecilia formosa TaxID=48698 RepID=A0A096LYS7_POEFO
MCCPDMGGYEEQLQSDAQFLCSNQRMDTELVDSLVLQLNRIYPQILSDKEACKFRSLRVPTTERLRELLQHLREKGDDACYEFYRALHIQAEDVYFSLPTRIREREGPIFFLSCFSVAVGIAFLYYYGVGDMSFKTVTSLQHIYSFFVIVSGSDNVLVFHTDDNKKQQ